MASKTLYVLYNADASVLGKLSYGYRKVTQSKDCENPACAACDITHGGLSLKETPQWIAAKEEIEAAGLKIVQWHRDEISSPLKEFLKKEGIKYPTTILEESEGEYKEVVSSAELTACKGNPETFMLKLKEKGLLENKASVSL
ncbi:hypothetical protein BDY21DRAFT_374886 [Lineolata rhizophorae]|uniref:Uncharacterized protein n=1 Tax=Lineolata rhizophorae TaxID=578093 RepID=A0A6A6NNL7_9PEZI|nr:hypothetical protein BDY21DRAFT_374886 [Lineolata rhizophorae]